MKPDECYLNPGIFWWAFRPQSAELHGLSETDARKYKAKLAYPGTKRGSGIVQPTVLLIDEIDKAEPDLPNDLLEPMDRRRFELPEGFLVDNEKQIAAPPTRQGEPYLLTVITTNRERELPQAFLRRCAQLQLPDPDKNKLIEIGKKHFPPGEDEAKLRCIEEIAALIDRFRERARDNRLRTPGTAEFLDAVRACDELNIEVDNDEGSIWRQLELTVLDKSGQLRKTSS